MWAGVTAAAVLVAAAVVAVFSGSAATSAAAAAGLIPADASQNSGGFITSVGIEVPGYHGIEPKLALTYSSTFGNGPVGVGWQLAGESVIARVSAGRGAPRFNSTDIFLLDGERLVSSSSLGGTHVTKRQSFRKISFDSTAKTWTVWSADGVRSTYAVALEPVSGQPLRWLRSSVTDPHGNTVNYGYSCPGQKECYLSTVSYNNVVVTLYYETRPDPEESAAGGKWTVLSKRLKSVDVVAGGVRARAYALSYLTGASTGRSLLSTVRRYGSDATVGSTGTVTAGSSVPEITATYVSDPPSNGFTDGTAWWTNWCTNGGLIQPGDFDGDGAADLACRTAAGNVVVAISSRTGFGAVTTWATGFCGTGEFGAADVNGDGNADVYCHSPNTGATQVLFSNGSGAFTSGAATPSTLACVNIDGTAEARNFGVADINADGRADLWCHRPSNGFLFVVTWNGGVSFDAIGSRTTGDFCRVSGAVVGAADINGDGRADIYCHNPDTGGVSLIETNVDGADLLTAPVSSWLAGWCSGSGEFGVTDANGDGKADVFCHTSSATTGVTAVALSSGPGFGGGTTPLPDFCYAGRLFAMVDVNGDGRGDAICRVPETGTHRVALSHGKAYAAGAIWRDAWCVGAESLLRFADLTGDGKTDLVCRKGDTSNILVARSGATFDRNDLIKTVTTGLGAKTTVDYSPASRWSNTFMPPSVPMTVSSVSTYDGRSATSTTTLSYSGARWDPGERRFLGFGTVTATDASGASVTTTFRLTPLYPANRVASVVRRDAAGGILSRVDNTYSEVASAGVRTSLVSRVTQSLCVAGVCQSSATSYQYDLYGNVTQRLDEGDTGRDGDERSTLTTFGLTTSYLVGKPTATVTRRGLGGTGQVLTQTGYGYNAAGDVITISQWLDTTNTWVTTRATYDAAGNQITSTDPKGNTTATTYDATGVYPVRVCGPAGHCTLTDWDTAKGVATRVTDPNSKVTWFNYDTLGRMTAQGRPDGSWTNTDYLNWGNPTNQYQRQVVSDGSSDSLMEVDTYYDGLGRSYKTVRNNPNSPGKNIVVLTGYNARGLVAKVSNPMLSGATPVYTTYTYDALGRQTSLTHPGGAKTTTSYGVARNASDFDFAAARFVSTQCDETNACRRTGLDGYGRTAVVSEWTGAGRTGTEYRTRVSYDELGRVVRIGDAAGNLTSQTWDSLGRKTLMVDPDLGTWRYQYDAAGQLIAQTDARGQTVTATYDSLGRVRSQASGGTTLATLTYDEAGHGSGVGRLTSMTDLSGATSWSYDPAGRVTGMTKRVGAKTYTVSATYDPAGRRSTLTYPDGEKVTYSYGDYGCPRALVGPDAASAADDYVPSATCDTGDNLQSRSLGQDIVEQFTYDANRRWLTNHVTQARVSGTTWRQEQTEGYQRNARGQITRKTGCLPVCGSTSADVWDYGYDTLGRLTQATNVNSPALSSSYSYDAVGRITSSSLVGSYVYPTSGGHAHSPSLVAGQPYSYDANGNRTADPNATYNYDVFNRLRSVTAGGVATNYTYDGQGHRVTTGSLTLIEFDGQLLYQTDGTASSKFYYHSGDRVARRDSTGAVYYYTGNQVGTPTLMLDAAGSVLTATVTHPYGGDAWKSGTSPDPFGFTGGYRDSTRTVKLGARDLSPASGLFLVPDSSAAADPNAPQTLNRYSYAVGDPINLVDPTGRSATPALQPGGFNPSPVSVSTTNGQVSVAADLGAISLNASLPHGAYRGSVGVSWSGSFAGIGSYRGGGSLLYDDGGLQGASFNIGVGVGRAGNGATTGYTAIFETSPDGSQFLLEQSIKTSARVFGFSYDNPAWKFDPIVLADLAYTDEYAGSPFEQPQGTGYGYDAYAGTDWSLAFDGWDDSPYGYSGSWDYYDGGCGCYQTTYYVFGPDGNYYYDTADPYSYYDDYGNYYSDYYYDDYFYDF